MKLIIILTVFLISLNWTYAFINKRSSYTIKHKPNTYYVKFTLSPFTSPPSHIEAQHSNFHEELNNLGIDVKFGHAFKKYVNGVVIETEKQHIKRISGFEHVESIEPVKMYKRSKPEKPIEFNFNKKELIKRDSNDGAILVAPNNDINSVHEITGVKEVHEKLKLTGKGVKVGIIDSGIDYRHPALGGCFGPGCRVAYGYNFVDENGDPFDDCNGHGTHVSAIIGGLDPKTGFKGVATDVTFGVYKFLPCDESTIAIDVYYTFDIIIMRAIEKAVDDGMEIINLSVGLNGNSRNPATLMIDELAKHKGIIFTISMGNDGINGIFTGGYDPGVAHNSISVGSFETNKVLNFKAKGPNFVIDYIKGNSAAFPFNKAKVKSLSCGDDYNEFKNKIIFADFRKEYDCEFNFENVTYLGVIYVFPESVEGVTPAPDELEASITSKQAEILVKYFEKHSILELDFSDKYGYMEDLQFAETPSTFSSWGLTDELDIKPEISGPGGFILSAFPINLAPYTTLSGTSMSSPYMAGVAALYIEVFGKQSSHEQLKTAFMNYAIPHKDRNKLISPVLHQGAGLVSIYDTLRATSFVYPPKINLNDTINFNKHHTLTVYNTGRKEMKYKLSHLPAPSVNGYNKTIIRNYFQLEYHTKDHASVTFEKDLITVAPGASVKVSVTFTPPTNLPKNVHWFYSGWLEITPLDKSIPKMSVPYAGLADDSRKLPLFQIPEFPRLGNLTDLFMDDNKVETFTYNDTDIPIVEIFLATPTHKIIVEILDDNHKFLGVVKFFHDFFTTKVMSPFPLFWDGLIYESSNINDNDEGTIAPNGNYFLKVSALKLFGDFNNKEDYEVWVSPKFRIERIDKAT